MAEYSEWQYDEVRRAMAQKTDSTRSSSRRSSRVSPVQNTRRHSVRVEKPRSYHQSPRTPDRRRNVATPRHYSVMEDHYRRMMGIDDEDEQNAAGDDNFLPPIRPVSWHPSSNTSYGMYNNGPSANQLEDPSPTSQYLSSYQNSPFYQTQRTVPESESTWSQYMHGRFEGTSTQHRDYYAPQPSTSWFNTSESHPANGLIRSSWAETHDEEERGRREESVELVGLGLYDEPGFTVKIGSKLEEECEPPEFDPIDDDDEDSSEEEEEELPKPDDANVPQASVPLVDMSGRSFFLGPDEGEKASTATWWSDAETRRPASHIGAANYGWI